MLNLHIIQIKGKHIFVIRDIVETIVGTRDISREKQFVSLWMLGQSILGCNGLISSALYIYILESTVIFSKQAAKSEVPFFFKKIIVCFIFSNISLKYTFLSDLHVNVWFSSNIEHQLLLVLIGQKLIGFICEAVIEYSQILCRHSSTTLSQQLQCVSGGPIQSWENDMV